MVRLNVGGSKFDTSESTIIGCEYFASMFQSGFGHSTDDDQRIFIDRDGDLFGVILASLRTGRRPSQAIVEAKRPELLVECEYYGIQWLSAKLCGVISPFDLRPEDRRLRSDETAARGDATSHILLNVHEVDMSPLPPDDLQIPLLMPT